MRVLDRDSGRVAVNVHIVVIVVVKDEEGDLEVVQVTVIVLDSVASLVRLLVAVNVFVNVISVVTVTVALGVISSLSLPVLVSVCCELMVCDADMVSLSVTIRKTGWWERVSESVKM